MMNGYGATMAADGASRRQTSELSRYVRMEYGAGTGTAYLPLPAKAGAARRAPARRRYARRRVLAAILQVLGLAVRGRREG